MSKLHFPLPQAHRKSDPTHPKNYFKDDPQTLQNRAQKPSKNRLEIRSPKKPPKIRKSTHNCLQNGLPRVSLFVHFWLLAPLWPAMGSNMAPRRPPGGPKTPKSPDFDPPKLRNGTHLAPKIIKHGAQMGLDTQVIHRRIRTQTHPRKYTMEPLVFLCVPTIPFYYGLP